MLANAPQFKTDCLASLAIYLSFYQDNVAVMSELRVNYKPNPRWSVLGFGGIGKAADSISDSGSGDARMTIGIGLRYPIFLRLGLRAAIDIARGPEEWALYIQVGSAWLL